MAHDTLTDTSGISAGQGCPAKGEPLPPRAFGIRDVCGMTGLGRTSIYAAIKSGDLVARKWKRRTVVLADDLAAFLSNLPKLG